LRLKREKLDKIEKRSKSRRHIPRKASVQGFPNPYFGIPLDQILKREGGTVPLLVEKCVDYLVSKYLDEEGILRISGSTTELTEIRQQVERGMVDFTGRDPHCVAGVLKSFFRELPQPIVSQETNDGVTAMLGFGEGQEVLDEVYLVVHSLPPPSFNLLKVLVYFLIQVSSHSEKNRMNTNNLLRVMTPTINCAPGLISLAMDNYDFLFSDESDDEATHAQVETSNQPNQIPTQSSTAPATTTVTSTQISSSSVNLNGSITEKEPTNSILSQPANDAPPSTAQQNPESAPLQKSSSKNAVSFEPENRPKPSKSDVGLATDGSDGKQLSNGEKPKKKKKKKKTTEAESEGHSEHSKKHKKVKKDKKSKDDGDNSSEKKSKKEKKKKEKTELPSPSNEKATSQTALTVS